MLSLIVAQLAPVVVNAAVGAITAGVSYAAVHFAAWMKSKTQNEKLNGALAYASSITQTAFLDVLTQLGDETRAALADGKLSPDELAKIKADMAAAVQSHANGAVGELLGSALKKTPEELTAFLTAQVAGLSHHADDPTGLPAFTVSAEYAKAHQA